MTRSELIQTLASKYQLSNGDAAETVKIVLEAIAESLENGERVEIRGFGSFHVIERDARTGRNPKTGESVSIPAKKIPHFKPGKELKERVLQSID
jgi:integration host factor subunit beta